MNAKRQSEKFLIRRATAIAVATLTVLMFAVGLVFFQQSKSGEAARDWVMHTYEVRGHIRLFLSNMSEALINERGYLMTGDEEHLNAYQEVLRDNPKVNTKNGSTDLRRSVYQEIEIIRKLTADNASQQSTLDEIEQVSQKLLTHMSNMIATRNAQNDNVVFTKLNVQRTQELVNRLRSLVRIMESEENHLLALRIEADKLNTQQKERIVYASLGLFYVAMVLCICLYQRNRARAQAALQHYANELEKREEELTMQQEELKASNEEIEASNEELEEKTRALEEQNMQIQKQAQELEESQLLIQEKAREVERASKYKSEFLANMSHELRTPLNSLLILAKLLAANEQGNLTEEQIEEANIIHNGGLELLTLINDILDLSKVEAGKLTLIPEHVALEGIVKRMQQQFTPIANERGVAFPITLAQDLPPTLFTDTQRVEQILRNLLSNGFKFTEHGSVTLEIRRAQPTEVQRVSLADDASIAFSVIDTGIGIDASKFKDIFEAFQQEDGSIDRHYGGTGLGLTIARKFAHMLGGEIHITSEKGKGSCFTLILPLTLSHVEETSVQDGMHEAARIEMKPMPKTWMEEFIADDRKNINPRDKVLLIIEDDKNFAATLVKIARNRGYKCLAAGDGKSGLLLATEEPVTAVILDLSLPDMDGVRVLDQLKHNLKTRHIPVHIITGRDMQENTIPLRKGAIGYLTKPVEIEMLDGVFTRIEGLLESEVKQVLVVEDDKKNQVAIQNLLRKKDVHITVVGTAKAAMEQVAETRFDCIILDLQLPDMSGFEWLEIMSKAPLPPVIIYTARELSEDENRRLSLYAGSIIIKGAKSPERLLDEVTLFLHSVESTLSPDQQEIIRMQHHPDRVLKDRTVLLVDDDLRNTFALSKLLTKHGMHIIIADNGQMALDKLNANPGIELVIMDVMMPIMDGYQAMREIRASKAFKALPIIALTARAMPEEQDKCMAAGANDYLTKPVDIERLLALLRVWLFKQEVAA